MYIYIYIYIYIYTHIFNLWVSILFLALASLKPLDMRDVGEIAGAV